MRRIVVVGGGEAGFYAAWKLEKKLRRGEASLTLVDPRPYMTYQPFLPEVAAGSIEPRHAAVSLRRHLHRTRIIAGRATKIDHTHKSITVLPAAGAPFELHYDTIVVTAGAVTRKFPVPGIAECAIGLKNVEEAIAVRDQLLVNLDAAAVLVAGPARRRLLTVVVVGGGFTGVEGFSELFSLAASARRAYPELDGERIAFHLVEAGDRILPQVSRRTAEWTRRWLERRGARVHVGTQIVSAEQGHVVLSSGEEFDAQLIIWAAGNAANPVVARHTDLPTDEHGLLTVRADLRVGTSDSVVEDAWAAGDDAAVPDLASRAPNAHTPQTAQHAVRQGKHVATNLARSLRGRRPRNYVHHNVGTVATLGLGDGVFQAGPIVIKGLPAWLMHRGYHVLAIPTWERKVRVLAVWLTAALFGRDVVSLRAAADPRAAFVTGGSVDTRAAGGGAPGLPSRTDQVGSHV